MFADALLICSKILLNLCAKKITCSKISRSVDLNAIDPSSGTFLGLSVSTKNLEENYHKFYYLEVHRLQDSFLLSSSPSSFQQIS